MKIRNISKDDLPKLSKLVNDEQLCLMENICFEHSKLSIDDNGKIISFLILIPHNIEEYYGGKIPVDRKAKFNANHLIEDIQESYKDGNQYELYSWYLDEMDDFAKREEFRNLFLESRLNHTCLDSVIWFPNNKREPPFYTEFYNYNDEIMVSIPHLD